MQRNRRPQGNLKAMVTVLVLFFSPWVARSQTAQALSSTDSPEDLKSLTSVVLQLQSQVQTLNSEVNEMRVAQQKALLQSEELRAELKRTKEQLMAEKGGGNESYAFTASQPSSPMSSKISAPTREGQEVGT